MSCDNYFTMTDQGDSFETWQGLRGPAGTTFTPSVSSAGVISWTNDGGKQNPPSVDIKGPQGPPGEPQTPSDAEPLMDGNPSAGSATTYARGDHRHPSDYNKAPVITDTASGAVVSFPDGADGLPLKSLVVQIEPVQASGTPTPESPLPISGWTGCNISHSGEDTSNPTVIPVTFPSEAGTVYGGTLDVSTGALTVTHGYLDLGSVNWVITDIDQRYFAYFNSSIIKRPPALGTPADILCSRYISGTYLDVYGNNIDNVMGVSTTGRVAIYDPAAATQHMTAEQFKTYVSGAQFVFEIAEPQTYTLDPVVIETLLGQNNIWADCGSVAVKYRADTKLYIDKKLAALVAALS